MSLRSRQTKQGFSADSPETELLAVMRHSSCKDVHPFGDEAIMYEVEDPHYIYQEVALMLYFDEAAFRVEDLNSLLKSYEDVAKCVYAPEKE